jgi:NAD-dependent dihydropyrimidine dehydrogenase PreA subunit
MKTFRMAPKGNRPPCATLATLQFLAHAKSSRPHVNCAGGIAAMPYVITEACIGVKDRACVDVCPVDCIYEGEDQLYIHPDECIDCGACEPECPVTAIFPEEDVPPELTSYIEKNREIFNSDEPPGRPER